MKAKKFTILSISLILVVILIPAIFIFVVDPLQLYHSQISLKEKTKYFKEQRHQNIGLINNFINRSNENYNTIIVGTSMSENFTPSKFEKLLDDGEKVLNLTMSGATPLEQYTLIKKALETGKIKRVFWDIHSYFLLSNYNQENKKHDFPYKLYTNSLFIQSGYYLFNEDYLKYSFDVFRDKVNWSKWSENLDTLYSWYENDIKNKKFEEYGNEKNLDKLNIGILTRNINYQDIINKDYEYDSIENYMLKVIREFPDIEFNIYFPPYSTWYYRTNRIDYIYRFLYARLYLVDKLKEFNNLHIYGFDNNYEIVNNIYNYKDYGHYRAEINDAIMNSMIKKENLLNEKNINQYLKNMIENINSYNKVYYKNLENEKFDIKKIDIEILPWKGSNQSSINFENSKLIYNENNFEKFSTLSTNINEKETIHSIKLDLELPKEKLNMISITLNNKSEYSHFFIKSENFNDGKIDLDKFKISKSSDNFEFGTIDKLTIRCYPEKSDSITNLKINSINFLKRKD